MTTVLDSLNAGLHRAMADDPRVFLIGEDIGDPYGGAFKVARGLATAFPGRVLTTPVSEAGIVGIGAGMALRGLRPVVEIMFGDFITLIADQLINSIAKFRWMYNDQVRVPLVVRTPMGGRRGYGPTHSQTLEKLYLGVPGLRILACSAWGDPGSLLHQAILEDDDPVLFIENKLLYVVPVRDETAEPELEIRRSDGSASYPPAFTLTVRDAPPADLTIAAYGHMAELASQAVLTLAYEHEVIAELVVPTQLAPFEVGPILKSTRRTGRLLVAEEGTLAVGWGAEIVGRTFETLGTDLRVARRAAADDHPIPASGPLEAASLPDAETIVQLAREMV